MLGSVLEVYCLRYKFNGPNLTFSLTVKDNYEYQHYFDYNWYL